MQMNWFAKVAKKMLVALIVFASLNLVDAADVSLSWNASSATNVAGYNIYYGTTSGHYTDKVAVGNVTLTTISNLTAGATYYFSATAFDSAGNESAHSNETKFIVPGVLTLSQGVNPGDPMLINFPVAAGHWYEVQATTDFKTWTTIWQTDVETTNDWVQFSDPDAGEFSSRFYRLILH
jgi:Fibronectin type III domain